MFRRQTSSAFNSLCRLVQSSRVAGVRLAAFTGSSSPTDSHKLYVEQMKELQEERTTLFGTDAAPEPSSAPETKEEKHSKERPFTPEEKARWLEQREQEFDFTPDDEQAWSTCGGSDHQHPASYLQEIERARARHQQEQGQQTNSMAPPSGTQEHTTLSHVSPDGQSVHMVDVGAKQATTRTAVAETLVVFPPAVLQALQRQGSNNELTSKKGPIFSTAITAGILAAKQTSALIPLCHPLPLSHVAVECTWWDAQTVRVECTCRVTHTTGVEMEALTGASVAALTIYDMVKAVSHEVRIRETRLIYKDGGKRQVDSRRSEEPAAM